MIRIKVYSLKNIIARVCFIILIIIISFSIMYFLKQYINAEVDVKKILESEIMLGEYSNNWTSNKELQYSLLSEQIKMLKCIDTDDMAEENEQIFEEIDTAVISHVEELYATKINDSKYKIDNVIINSYLDTDLNLDKLIEGLYIPKKEKMDILVYHTHTSESYTKGKDVKYEYSDYYRTENDLYNVVGIGNVFADECKKHNIIVDHNITKHDFPSYSGAYKASLKTIEKYIKNKKYDMVIDIHRDALSQNDSFRPTVGINGETAAKLMIVVGTNNAGLSHDNWMENLKFAIKLQKKANEMYPGLFRDLHLSTSRYNQHVSNRALIIEVGATGNTFDEAAVSMKYLSNVIAELGD